MGVELWSEPQSPEHKALCGLAVGNVLMSDLCSVRYVVLLIAVLGVSPYCSYLLSLISYLLSLISYLCIPF